ncbi:MAG: ATP-binding domain-containing protein, partial [Clostridia bacterium]|nr:ATP-binding domain-containing protein [Clostridia bacterium]
GAKTKLINFKALINSFVEFSTANPVQLLIKHILEKTDFLSQFEEKTEENVSKKYNISELINSAEQFVSDNQGVTLADYLNSVTLSSDTDAINDGNAVTVATIHAAKGLEYPNVFVVGCDEKILPSSRSIGDDDEIEEERRLMYVAVTRAKERLYITRANSRYMYGNREYMVQSRFLKEARSILFPNQPVQSSVSTDKRPDYYGGKYPTRDTYQTEDFGSSYGGGYSLGYAKRFLSDNKPKVKASNGFSKYRSGVKVKHVKFGEGVVITTKGEGENLIVDVAFKGVGIKSLSAKFAPMEII